MMNSSTNQILKIWNDYIASDKTVADVTGKEIPEIDRKRIEAIVDIRDLIDYFIVGDLDIHEFKTALDSYNKRNNLWGFTAIKGQMFFNQLVRTYADAENTLSKILKEIILEPVDLNDALSKIEKLENLISFDYSVAPDKRKVPKPSSVGYFLSYFWQIHNYKKWPILYSSMISTFNEVGIWEEKPTQKETYQFFFNTNEEIKRIVEQSTNTKPNNWAIEHCFWNLHLESIKETAMPKAIEIDDEVEEPKQQISLIRANFDIKDYVIPLLANLVELGEDDSKASSKKGFDFEKKVSDAFSNLNYDVDYLGQGRGREPDAIVKFRKENIAFIVDAKAYSNGFEMGTSDRAIKEYINLYCPKLDNDGYKKIGFIIVSNSFKSNFEPFINDITWNTPIKRFILLTTSALLHLIAYKAKEKLSVEQITDTLIKLGPRITSKEIIAEFDDV